MITLELFSVHQFIGQSSYKLGHYERFMNRIQSKSCVYRKKCTCKGVRNQTCGDANNLFKENIHTYKYTYVHTCIYIYTHTYKYHSMDSLEEHLYLPKRGLILSVTSSISFNFCLKSLTSSLNHLGFKT